MKRFWTTLATFSIVETIGRHPVMAGVLMLLGVGGGASIANLITPTLTPIPAAYFNENQQIGPATNGLFPNQGTAGALEVPADTMGSFAIYLEMGVDSSLQGENSYESFSPGMTLTGIGSPGSPLFGIVKFNWWNAPGSRWNQMNNASGGGSGSGYQGGFYPFSWSGGTGGPCQRAPSGVWEPITGIVQVTDPGFMCSNAMTIPAVSVPASGAQQTTVGTTCSGAGVISTSVAVAHGLTPGMQFKLSGYSGGTWASLNGLTYTALPGTAGTSIVASSASLSSCPTGTVVEGNALSGTGATNLVAPAIATSSLVFNSTSGGPTGITAKPGQRVCAVIGEYGDNSSFPGAAYMHAVDDKGVALSGAPALVPWLNQGVAGFNGTTTASSQILTVNSLPTTTISNAVFNSGSNPNGTVTFTTGSTATGLVAGSEFTVTGATPSGYNGTYVVLNPSSASLATQQAQTTFEANPLSGPAGNLSPIRNPGTYTANSGTMASVILPGATIIGASTSAVIAPYGQNGTTGAGQVTGFPLTYSLTVAQASGVTGNMAAVPAFYYSAVTSASPPYATLTAVARASLGDFFASFGDATGVAFPPVGPQKLGWGGSIGNIAMLYGVLPQTTGGAPATTNLSSLCKKTTDIQSFATTNGMTVNSLYRLNDIGTYGDSSDAMFTGYISGASGTAAGTATLNLSTPLYGLSTVASMPTNAIISSPGIAGCPAACPKLTTPSTGTITFATGVTSANLASSASPVAIDAGAFSPMKPGASITLSGYIDNGGGSTPTLHVTSLPTTPARAAATFTGSLVSSFTGGTGGVSSSTLTVTAPTTSFPVIGVGTVIQTAIGTPLATVTGQLTSTVSGGALGLAGTYSLNTAVTIASSTTIYGTGALPAGPTSLVTSGVTGTITSGMFVTDGGASLTGPPLVITGGSGSVDSVAGNYYSPIINDTAMIGSQSTVAIGEYVSTASGVNPGVYTPVKVIGYGTGSGGVGTYLLSGAPNSTGLVGSSGSPVTFTGTTISDGGAIAPGQALTIHDTGPGATVPVTPSTISCASFGSCTGTGTVFLSGTYDTSLLGGAPSAIQAKVSLSAGGPSVPGCSACSWTNLSSYSATLSSGTVYAWKGQALSIPASGSPLFVSVRAANGTAYAMLQNSIRVGLPFDGYGQGQFEAFPGAQSGINLSYFTGLWGGVGAGTPFGVAGNEIYLMGPPVAGSFTVSAPRATAGDPLGIGGSGAPLSEGLGNFEQLLTNAFGWPASFASLMHDGTGEQMMMLGNVTQTQTIGVGDGSSTTRCSASAFCTDPSGGIQQPLTFSDAAQTGAQFTGTISGSTLTVGSTMISGALMPGMLLTYSGSSGTTALQNCIANCGSATAIAGSNSQWKLSNSPGNQTGIAMRADYPQTGGTPWPTYNFQTSGALPLPTGGYAAFVVKPGTFKVSVNGTVICQDTQTFAYNNTGGNCTDSSSNVLGFVNYQTGDYEITFLSAPANNAPIVATWTNLIPPTPLSNGITQGVDYFGDGTNQSGSVSSILSRMPSGLAGHIDSSCSTEEGFILQDVTGTPTNHGYQYGAPGYSTAKSWLFDTKFPIIPGLSSTTPFISFGQFRAEGAAFFTSPNNDGKLDICDQEEQDIATKSTWTGHISGTTMTLDSNAVGPMWEGEVVGVSGVTSPTGIFIQSLASGAWGASGSTYTISNAGSVSVSTTGTAMSNDVFYKGPGPAIYAGTGNDIIVQNQGLCATCVNPHMAAGLNGGRRVGARLAATIWEGFNGNTNVPPSTDRVKAHAGGCDSSALASPCFDVGNTYAASASGTISGSTVTFGSGLTAHARPFVVGMAISCSGCTAGRYITSVSAAPTQSTTSRAGQVGNSFTITANGSLGVSTTETVTGGCSGTSGTGSNCIDIAFSINTPGTFGTAAAIATCGANNLNGAAPNYQPPAGVCSDNGIGEITRGFRIGTNQNMYGVWGGSSMSYPTGNVFDDGVDFFGGFFTQSAAYTCNIVAAKVVQCVKGPAYTSGVPTGVGQWSTGSTFVNYGDPSQVSGRMQSLLGYVGGQSFPFTAGSGYTNGTYTIQTTCTTIASGGHAPYFDVTVSGGAIVNVVPSATTASQATGLGVGSTCTVPLTALGGGVGGAIATIPLAPNEGQGGIGTFNTDTNTLGMFLYDNTGFPGNPLNPFFTNGQGGYFEPGLPVRPFGIFQGAVVSG